MLEFVEIDSVITDSSEILFFLTLTMLISIKRLSDISTISDTKPLDRRIAPKDLENSLDKSFSRL